MSAVLSKREKYTERKIILSGELQRETALAMVRYLPIDSDRPLELVAREQVKGRGLDANGYYWLRLGEIASQAWFNNRQYNEDTWHEYAKRHIMPEEITTKDGVIRSKWEETPDGTLTVISTTKLERKCFAEYTEMVVAFGANLGVMYSANPRECR